MKASSPLFLIPLLESSWRVGIGNNFFNFYTNIRNESNHIPFSTLVHALPNNLKTISEWEGAYITEEVIKVEVFHTLMSLSTSKRPCLDGFHVALYWVFWNDIGDKCFDAIKYSNFPPLLYPNPRVTHLWL